MTVRPTRSIILSPTAAGSLGDQAMIDVLVTKANELFGRPPSVLPNAYTIRSPARILDMGASRAQQIGGLAEVVRAEYVLAVGADGLDGLYGIPQRVKRLRLMEWAYRLGAKVRVIGSSFSETPRPEMIDRLRRMPWLEILARDPVSKLRMESALDREVKLVADVAFLLKPQLTSQPARRAAEWIAAARGKERRPVGLNVSGLVFQKLPKGTLERFADIVARNLAELHDIATLVIPHDWRSGEAGDLDSCRTVYEILRVRMGERCHLIDEPITSWDAKAIAGLIDCALLCRMHFAVACLGQGISPYCLVSAGKFEGLMEHFGLTGNLFDPADLTTPEQMLRPVNRMLQHWVHDAETVKAALPTVMALSEKNFDELGAAMIVSRVSRG